MMKRKTINLSLVVYHSFNVVNKCRNDCTSISKVALPPFYICEDVCNTEYPYNLNGVCVKQCNTDKPVISDDICVEKCQTTGYPYLYKENSTCVTNCATTDKIFTVKDQYIEYCASICPPNY